MRIRGIGLRGVTNYLRRNARAGLVDEVVSKLPSDWRPGPAGFLSASSYEVGVLDALLRAYMAELERASRAGEADARFRSLGAFIAEDNLNTVFKLVLSMVKPHTFVEKLPTLWALYFTDIDARVKMLGERRGVCEVRGTSVAHLAPVACGWIEFGLRYVGAKAPLSCREDGWSAGHVTSPEARYVVEWS